MRDPWLPDESGSDEIDELLASRREAWRGEVCADCAPVGLEGAGTPGSNCACAYASRRSATHRQPPGALIR